MHIPELALWRAVIDRALRDAMGEIETAHNKSKQYRNRITSSARMWFRMNSTGYRVVCELAQIEPDALRERVMKLLPPEPKRAIGPRKRILAPKRAAQSLTI